MLFYFKNHQIFLAHPILKSGGSSYVLRPNLKKPLEENKCCVLWWPFMLTSNSDNDIKLTSEVVPTC